MKKVVAVVVLVLVVNLGLRLVDLPDVDLPSFDVPDWLAQVNRIKNFVIGGVIVLAVIGAVRKSRER